MKKRLICALLCGALCLSPVFAAGTEEKFPAVKEYPGFADVVAGSWYESAAKTCYEVGLMNGTNLGFEPGKVLTVGECVAVAARIRETLTGETIPTPAPGESIFPWYYPYVEYMREAEPTLTGIIAYPIEECNRYMFLRLLSAAVSGQAGLLEPINEVTVLPDSEDEMVLEFYRAGILTGKDKYGTFDAYGSLSRAECAAMVARLVRSELRLTFVPADPGQTPAYQMTLALKAAYLPSGAVVLVGVTSEEFLAAVNESIARWETALGDNFNWHADGGDGKTVLEHVKEETLRTLGVTEQQGGELYQNFDYQVYYSRLIDLTGETLGG